MHQNPAHTQVWVQYIYISKYIYMISSAACNRSPGNQETQPAGTIQPVQRFANRREPPYIYIYMYICMYIYTLIYEFKRVCAWVYIYMHTYKCACVCVLMCKRARHPKGAPSEPQSYVYIYLILSFYVALCFLVTS